MAHLIAKICFCIALTDFDYYIEKLDSQDLPRLYEELGLQRPDIEEAERNANTYDVRLKARQVLELWRQKNGQQATYGVLDDAYCKVGFLTWEILVFQHPASLENTNIVNIRLYAVRIYFKSEDVKQIEAKEQSNGGVKCARNTRIYANYRNLEVALEFDRPNPGWSSSEMNQTLYLTDLFYLDSSCEFTLSKTRREVTIFSGTLRLSVDGEHLAYIALSSKFTDSTPAEILARGPEAIEAYREAVLQGKEAIHRTRLMLVGQERVGKTSLMKNLTHQRFDEGEDITDGIDISNTCSIDILHSQSWKPQENEDGQTMFSEAVGTKLAIKVKEGHMSTKPADLIPDKQEDGQTMFSEAVGTKLAIKVKEGHMSTKQADFIPDKQDDSSRAAFRQETQFEREHPSEESNIPSVKQHVGSDQDDARHKEDTDTDTPDLFSLSIKEQVPEKKEAVNADKQTTSPSESTVPPDILAVMDRKLNLDDEDITCKPLVLSIWDFAGQNLYYTTHQVFLSARCIYIVVFDLRHDLTQANPSTLSSQFAKYVGWFKARIRSTSTQLKKHSKEQSALEMLDFWMRSIYTFVISGSEQANKDQYSPPIIIVGTHRGSVKNNKIQSQFATIRDFLKGKCYEKDVEGKMYAVENSLEDTDDDEVVRLRQYIEDVARRQSYMGEEIPIRWLQFEKDIDDEISRGSNVMELEKVKQTPGAKMVASESELIVMLQFYHDLGNIVYFADGGPDLKDFVVLDPDWLIDVFRKIISCKDPDISGQDAEKTTELRKSIDIFKQFAILDDNLANFLWRDLIDPEAGKDLKKDYLIKVMDKFDLLCERLPERQNKERSESYSKSYYVPSRLRPFEYHERKLTTIVGPSRTFYIDFCGFLPDGFFNRMLTRCARWSQEQGGLEPELHFRHAIFYVDDYHEFEVEMSTPKDARVKVIVFPARERTGNIKQQKENHLVISTNKVRSYLESTLQELRRIWAKGIMFEFMVACPCSRYLHFLNLQESLEQNIAKCTYNNRVDTAKIRQRFTEDITVPSRHVEPLDIANIIQEMESINIGQECRMVTSSVSSSGAELCLLAAGVHLRIPEGAIPEGRLIQASLSLPDEKEYTTIPPLDNNHTLICPIVRCQPEGINFLKPAILTLPTCVVQNADLNVTLWTRSSQTEGQWLKALENQDILDSSRKLISIANKTVTIELLHFSEDTVSGSSPTDREILVFQTPASLETEDYVYITVYSVPDYEIAAVEAEEEIHQGVRCAKLSTMQIRPNKNNLEISLSEILPSRGWKPLKKNREIGYELLQAGNRQSKCEFRFEKTRTNVSKIAGSVTAIQKGTDGTDMTFMYFDGCMIPKRESKEHHSLKRVSTSAKYISGKRSRSSTDKDMKRELSEDQLLDLSFKIKEDWYEFGLELGYTRAHLREYKDMGKSSGRPAGYHMLESWRNNLTPSDDGCEILKTTLRAIGQPDLLDDIFRSRDSTETAPEHDIQEDMDTHTSNKSVDNTGEKQLSDKDISDVVDALKTAELKNLYEQLGLSQKDVENAEASGDHTDPSLKAKDVLHQWRQINGKKATKQRILDALKECKYNYSMESLQKK